ncbi:MAG: PspA/IM30 family protein [Candidatus Obscuribacterales bacterium]|nr:PspA/IM30 family protein [Candidatus Obscuribacterales bacterium]
MSEELAKVRSALVDAVAAKKLIAEKLAKAKDDLAKWRKRLSSVDPVAEPQVAQEVQVRIRQLEVMSAEWQADYMAQEDLEGQLKQTIFRLEHSVPQAQIAMIPNSDEADATIQRMEGKILEQEALAELSAPDDKEKKLDSQLREADLNNELLELKKKLKKDNTKEP